MEARRHKLNLQGLLQFALEQTKSEDAKGESTFTELDEERKTFLENALKSMTVDVINELQASISTLESPTAATPEKLNALNTIREYVDNIDFANNFVKVGGTQIILKYLKCEESQLRVAAIYIVAELSQNNPFCQQHFLDIKVLHLLMPYFEEPEDIASSALHAVSSLIRNFPPGLAEFLRIGGVNSIMSCLNTSSTRVFIKACFLIACLSKEQQMVKDEFVKQSAVPKLISKMDHVSEFDIKTETILYALSELTTSDKCNLSPVMANTISNFMDKIISQNSKLAQCEEMIAYAERILSNIESANATTTNEVYPAIAN